RTQQRNMLIAFFESHPDRSFTIDEIAEALHAQAGMMAPSRSTIYRTVSDLEADGAVQRRFLADKRRSAYRYRDKAACASHLHLQCKQCNALTHLDSGVSHAIARLLRENGNLSLDMSGTVLIGGCAKCGLK
ncbi:MAG: transcriptional repressor, partial [Christensenellaceae bacterium]|nr:transcriptional repressor [Christensenellaceae bacterium]